MFIIHVIDSIYQLRLTIIDLNYLNGLFFRAYNLVESQRKNFLQKKKNCDF